MGWTDRCFDNCDECGQDMLPLSICPSTGLYHRPEDENSNEEDETDAPEEE